MVPLGSHDTPLSRQSAEGVLIGDLDSYQEEGRVISLNSKKDFMQAHTVTLNFHTGARNEY